MAQDRTWDLRFPERTLYRLSYWGRLGINVLTDILILVIILCIQTDRPWQTESTQIRLLPTKQSDLGLHCFQLPLLLLDALGQKKKNMCVSGFSSEKKNRCGRSALSFHFIKIVYIETAFFTTFPPIFSIFDNILLATLNKKFRVGAKPRWARETWNTHIYFLALL